MGVRTIYLVSPLADIDRMEVFEEGQLEQLYREKCGPPNESSLAFVTRMFSKLLRYAHEFDRFQYTIDDLQYMDGSPDGLPTVHCFNVITSGVRLAGVRWEFPKTSSSKFLIIYVHTNTRSLCDAMEVLPLAKQLQADLVAFDLPGSGKSEGILNAQVSQQLLDVIKFVTSETKIPNVVLWGRGTGTFPVMDICSTVIPKLNTDLPFVIRFIVLDSPFTSMKQVVQDLIAKYESLGYYFPHSLFGMVSRMLRVSIQRRAGVDLYDIKPIDLAPSISIPSFILAATCDDYFHSSHGVLIRDKWGAPSVYTAIPGSQFSKRSPSSIMLTFNSISHHCGHL